MGFLNDMVNMLLADLVTPNGGDRYFMYTLFRDDMSRRNKQAQLERERIEYEKEHQKRLKEIHHLEFNAMRAKNDLVNARKKREDVEELEMNYYLSKAGYKTFEEMCEKRDLNSPERWEQFVKLNPQFKVCDKKHRIYLLRTCWK